MTAALPIDSEPPGANEAPGAGEPGRLLDRLFREHRGAILAVCLAHTRDPHEAEDCVQETFLKILDKVGELRDPAHSRAWLFQIARRVCIDRARRPRATRPLADTPAPTRSDERNAAPPDAGDADRAARLHAALARLPAEYRETLALYYLDGRDCAQVAAALGVTAAAVRQRLVRGRLKLHDLLVEDPP